VSEERNGSVNQTRKRKSGGKGEKVGKEKSLKRKTTSRKTFAHQNGEVYRGKSLPVMLKEGGGKRLKGARCHCVFFPA